MAKRRRSPPEIVAALMRYGNTAQAAQALGLSESRLRDLKRTPEIYELWEQTRAEALKDAAASLADGSKEAVQVLRDVMADAEVTPQLRVNAADALLRHTLKYAEIVTIQTRLDNIEERLNNRR